MANNEKIRVSNGENDGHYGDDEFKLTLRLANSRELSQSQTDIAHSHSVDALYSIQHRSDKEDDQISQVNNVASDHSDEELSKEKKSDEELETNESEVEEMGKHEDLTEYKVGKKNSNVCFEDDFIDLAKTSRKNHRVENIFEFLNVSVVL